MNSQLLTDSSAVQQSCSTSLPCHNVNNCIAFCNLQLQYQVKNTRSNLCFPEFYPKSSDYRKSDWGDLREWEDFKLTQTKVTLR